MATTPEREEPGQAAFPLALSIASDIPLLRWPACHAMRSRAPVGVAGGNRVASTRSQVSGFATRAAAQVLLCKVCF
jgi:hypothetical protein